MPWIDELADTLEVDRLSQPEIDALLESARDVAHRVERKVTPLSTFLMGVAVGRGASIDSVRSSAASILPPEEA